MYFLSPLWICVKGDHLNMKQGRKEGGSERGMEREGGQKQLKGRRGVTPWSNFSLLTIQACDVFIHLSLVIPSSLLPILTFLHPFFHISCFLSYHSFILPQVLKSSLVFSSSCGFFCLLWGHFQATVGRQPVVPPQELTARSHKHDLTTRAPLQRASTFCFGLTKKKCSK